LTGAAIAKVRKTGIEKAFKLSSTVDIGNMHAFTSAGNMRKYANELDILQDFFDARRQLYHERKNYQMGALGDVCHRLQQKIKFIQLVVAGHFSFAGKRRPQLLEEFKKHTFDEVAPEYLLAMPMWNLTQEKKDSLATELAKHVTALQQLQKTSPEDLWRHDLNQIENFLKPPVKKRSHTSQGQTTNKRKR
jgi:DNA topoisomerase-2